jgi:asparagine synthase (glutamine-hydrolysing)
MTGLCSDEHAWYLAMVDRLLADKTTTLYDGIAGDVFTEPVFFSLRKLELFRADRLDALAEVLLSDNEAALSCVLSDLPRKNLARDRAVARMMQELIKHRDAPNPVDSFYFWNRTRREIALSPYGLMRNIPRVFSPYLDHDLFDLIYSLPPETLAGGEFHSETIRRFYPNYADLPFEDKKTPPVDARAHDAQLFQDLARSMLGRIHPMRGLMRGRYLLPRLVYGLMNRRYAETTAWVAPLILYLFQLETVASKDLSWNGRVS